jgi:hypothetical protein
VQVKEFRCRRRIGIQVSLIRDKLRTTKSQLIGLSEEPEKTVAPEKIGA